MRISDWSSDVCSSDLCAIPVNAAELGLPAGARLASSYEIEVSAAAVKSLNILVEPGARLGAGFENIIVARALFAAGEWITVMDAAMDMKDLDSIKALLMAMPGVLLVEENLCRTKEHDTPDDPHFRGKGAWGQRHDDQRSEEQTSELTSLMRISY